MPDIILSLNKFGVGFSEKVILTSVDLDIYSPGITVLIGPAGTGKSTLLRTLAGINQASPSLRQWGDAIYAGEELGTIEYPAMVAQNTKLMMSTVLENVVHDMPERRSLSLMQKKDVAARMLKNAGLSELCDQLDKNVVELSLGVQRHLAIVRTAAASPKLMLIDEPTTGIKDFQSILNCIKSEAQRRAIIVVLHNQDQAKFLDGRTALIAGGWIHEVQETKQFFTSPQSPAAIDFVRSGSCCVPSPDTKPEDLDDSFITIVKPPPEPEQARKFISDAFGPRNFLWLDKGRLAGTPRPGLFIDLDYDLKALKRVGVDVLVSLTTKPIDQQELTKFDIQGIWFPIVDMSVPTINGAKELCQKVQALLDSGHAIAMHCKAGLGRTGTMLAAQSIWQGHSAFDALEAARKIEPRWVQSEEQVAFLSEFAQALGCNDDGQKLAAN